jgi:nicotinamide mononucleotide transporter
VHALLAAAAPLLAQAFSFAGTPVTWVEVVAFALSIAMVVCNIRVHVAGWPLAIASSLLYVLLFWSTRLYGDASLQVFFAAVAAWGWWQWLRGTDAAGRALRVRHLGAPGRTTLLGAIAIAWPATALFLARFTDTDVPWWDAFPTSASIVGQWLLGRKYVENWPVWIVVDVVGAALFAYKGLWLTTVLYAVFVAMAFVGWRQWRAIATTATPPAELAGS